MTYIPWKVREKDPVTKLETVLPKMIVASNDHHKKLKALEKEIAQIHRALRKLQKQ